MALLGGDLMEKEGARLLTKVHPQDRSAFSQVLTQALTQPKTALPPCRLQTKQGPWCWLAGDVINMSHDLPGLVLVLLLKKVAPPGEGAFQGNEASGPEKKNARKKILQWELENLSLVASKTTNGVIITDNQYHIEWVNEGFTKHTGYTLDEVLGLRPEDFLYGQDAGRETADLYRKRLLHNLPLTLEILNYTKKGDPLWFLTEVTPVLNEQGKTVKFISIRTDITEKKNRESELLSLTKDLCDQNRDLQQFTYIVSHNLRAPIANALGLANLLADLKPGEDLLPEITKNMKTSIRQLDTVIKDINLILSIRDNKDTLALEEVTFKTVFNQVMHNLSVSLLECQGEINLEVPEGYTFRSHKAYLFSILHNLISNAIKYRSPQRPLQIKLECQGTPERGTTISCCDNGLGLNLETAGKNLFKLYKRFHTGIPGRGIGLYLVKTHVETLGGEIKVWSSPNKGARFFINLPE